MRSIISAFSIIFFLLFYLYGAYYHSYKSGHISLNSYDANIALAHGNKPFIIVMSTISFILLIWLMILNKHQSRFYIRITLLIIMWILIQVLLWLNPDKIESILIGGIILAATRMFIMMTCMAMFKNNSLKMQILLGSIIILVFIGIVLQITIAYFAQSYYEIIHSRLENYVILMFLLTIVILAL